MCCVSKDLAGPVVRCQQGGSAAVCLVAGVVLCAGVWGGVVVFGSGGGVGGVGVVVCVSVWSSVG